MNIFKNLILLLAIILLSGCMATTQDRVQKMLQTSAANDMKKDYKEITQELIILKEKLDKRNPQAYNKNAAQAIYTQIDNLNYGAFLNYNGKKLQNYKEYLDVAFSKDEVFNRNDYLIIGLYKEIYDAYDIKTTHQITALTYDENKIQNLYKNLQILKWKLSHAKSNRGEYLFLTWQNNWQIEFEKKLKRGEIKTYEDILNLKYIKENKESLLSPSNASFEVILSMMIYRVKQSLETLGVEPVDIGLEVVKTMIFFI